MGHGQCFNGDTNSLTIEDGELLECFNLVSMLRSEVFCFKSVIALAIFNICRDVPKMN